MSLLASRRLLPLRILLWIVPLAAVVWWAAGQPPPQLPDSTGAVLALVGAIAVYAVATLGRAERWHQILRHADVDADRRDSWALVPVGYMGNNVLPARGGEVLRVFLLGARTPANKRTILGTVFAERVLDAAALGVILLIAAFNLLSSIALPSGHVLLLIAGGLAFACVLAAVAILRSATLSARLTGALKPLLRPCRALASGRGAMLLALTVAIWALEAGVYVVVGESISLHLGVRGGLSVVAFSNLCALVPAAPGYLGTYDVAVGLAVKAAVTVTGGVLAAYILLLRFVLFVPITLAGLVLLFARYGGLSRLRAARAAAA